MKCVRAISFFLTAVLLFTVISFLSGCTETEKYDSDFYQIISSMEYELSKVMIESDTLRSCVEKAYSNATEFVTTVDKSGFSEINNDFFYRVDQRENVSVLASGYVPIDEDVKRVVYLTQAIDTKLSRIVSDTPFIIQAWFLSKESVCRISPPFNYREVTSGMDLTDYQFYNLVAPVRNRERVHRWTKKPYVDPAGNGWMISALAPVYYKNEFMGAVGVDVSVDVLLDQFIPQAIKNKILIVDQKGVTVWTGSTAGKIFGIPEMRDHKYFEMVYQDTFRSEDYSILKSRKREIRKLSREIMTSDNTSYELRTDSENYTINAGKIDTLGWLVLEVDKSQ